MTTTIRFALPVALVLMAAATARAQGQAAAVETQQPAESYRLQIVATDAVGYGLLTVGAVFGDASHDPVAGALLFTGGLTFFAGGPVVHLTHREVARAAISFAVRAVLPFLGANIGARFANCHPGDDSSCSLDDGLAGLAIGAVAASVIDATLIAPWSTGAPRTDKAPAVSRGLTLAPRIVATPELALLGVGGRF